MAASRFIDQARFSEPRRAVGAAPLRSLVPWYVGQSTAIGSRVGADDGEVVVEAQVGGGPPVVGGACGAGDPLQPATSTTLSARLMAARRMAPVFPPAQTTE